MLYRIILYNDYFEPTLSLFVFVFKYYLLQVNTFLL